MARPLSGERLCQAESLLLVLQEPLADDLLDSLVQARGRGVTVEVLFHRFRDGAYLARLHEAGMRLFETGLGEAQPSALFVDRREGYTLPGWEAIDDPSARAYELLWRRLGVVIAVDGRVKQIASGDALVELEASRPVFLDPRGLGEGALLREGCSIRALGVVAFMGMKGMALLLDVLQIEPAAEDSPTGGS